MIDQAPVDASEDCGNMVRVPSASLILLQLFNLGTCIPDHLIQSELHLGGGRFDLCVQLKNVRGDIVSCLKVKMQE
ncbi:MAG: hypothetical protein ABSH48_08745 [Verrucomicrobiota bacterium]